MPIFEVNVNGQEATVEVTRQGNELRVHYDGKTTDLRLIHSDGPFFVMEQARPDGTRHLIRAAGHADGDQRQMWVNGHTFTYSQVRRQPHTAAGHNTGSLSASIPAVVVELLVSQGDRVAAGDKLILLESMKMVIPIQAPYPGIVSKINCAAGESVSAGILLIELEEISD